jgi:hypothetical protein
MRFTLVGVLAAALLLCGCGRSSDRAQVEQVAGRFLQAAGSDGPAACAQLSQDAVKQLEQQEQGACASSVGKLGVTPSAIRKVELYALNAKIDLANGASVFAEQTAQGWRISAVACRPTDGPPQSHPMSCELES